MGKRDDRPGPEACLKSLREGDTLIVWKHDLTKRYVDFRILTGQRVSIDTATSSGPLVFGIFAARAEFDLRKVRASCWGGAQCGGRSTVVLNQMGVHEAHCAISPAPCARP